LRDTARVPIRYPQPLQAGDRIAVIAPSSGVPAPLHPRLDLVLAHLRAQGFVVEEGRSLREEVFDASASADARADELMRTLMREDVQAIFPPWGGELAIEVPPRLDWAALRAATPKWCIGYSDNSTWMLPLTLRLGWATAHATGLMDLVPGQNDSLTSATLPLLATPTGGRFEQRQSAHWQLRWTDFEKDPGSTFALTEATHWRALNRRAGDAIAMRGRLVGGCLDTLMHLQGTPHGDVPAFVRACGAEGAIVFLENAEQAPTAVLRALCGLRAAGWFDGVAGLLLGRSAAPDASEPNRLTYLQALHQSVGDLPCPVLYDVDIGHRPPQLLLVNGALAEVSWSEAEGARLVQTLG
jgi:muramoyltetrapeptide carboxypeptidase